MGQLLDDPDVALHAMAALRRVPGPDAVLPHLRFALAAHGDDPLGRAASREVRKAESELTRRALLAGSRRAVVETCPGEAVR